MPSFTRPADTTAYASGDLVANSTTAGSVAPIVLTTVQEAGGSRSVQRVRLSKSGTSVTNASFRLHLYNVAPTCANGDNGAWSTTGASGYLGSVDVTIDKAFTDGATGSTALSGANFVFDQAAALYGLLEARAAYTPISGEVFTVNVDVLTNPV